MGIGLLLGLAGLALLDSTSFGTFVVPLVVLVAMRRVDPKPFGVYLGTVYGFYFLVGVALLFGIGALLEVIGDALASEPVAWLQLAIGIGLVGLGIWLARRPKDTKPRRSFMPASFGPRAMATLALGTTTVEVATMWPYLAAVGLLSAADTSMTQQIAVLAIYCVVMILPAIIVLLVVRRKGAEIWPRLQWFTDLLMQTTRGASPWLLTILGIVAAVHAAGRLS